MRRDAGLPSRLLAIGLPLTVILGAIVAYALFPGEGIGFALLIGAILAPTDAALGLPIFANPRMPVRIRRALSIESGLNDGLATLLVTLFIALAVEEQHAAQGGWLFDSLSEIGLGIFVGVIGGLVGGRLFVTAVANNWTTTTAQRVGNLAMALGIYFSALSVGGNGFVAAFADGLVFGEVARFRLHEATEFTEESGTALSMLVWTIFGTSLVAPLVRALEPRAFVFAIVALTIVRMVPVAISLIGTGFRKDTLLVMGWLGPRGLASVIFMLIAVDTLRASKLEVEALTKMAGWAIVLSVLLHAITPAPLAAWYARRLENAASEVPELLPVYELAAHESPGKHRSFGTHLNLMKDHHVEANS